MEQILWVYDIREEIVTARIKPCKKKKKAMVRSPDGDTGFFDIVVGVFQRDKLISYLFITCLGYVIWIPIDLFRENGLIIKKKVWIRSYPAKNITDADSADDLALRTDTPPETKSLLYSLKRTASTRNQISCVLDNTEQLSY